MTGSGVVVTGEPEIRRSGIGGTAPAMTADLAAILRAVRARLPAVVCEQLPVSSPADDDGLWFFTLPGRAHSVQIESPNGVCPFLIETTRHDDSELARSVDDVVRTVVAWLGEAPPRLA